MKNNNIEKGHLNSSNNKDSNNQDENNDVKVIKSNIKDIIHRIGRLDERMLKDVYEETKELVSEFKDLKAKVLGNNESKLEAAMNCHTCKISMMNAVIYMGLGALMVAIVKR